MAKTMDSQTLDTYEWRCITAKTSKTGRDLFISLNVYLPYSHMLMIIRMVAIKFGRSGPFPNALYRMPLITNQPLFRAAILTKLG